MTQLPSPGRLFAYGTLLFPEVVHALLRHTPSRVTAHLRSHARFAMHGQSYPGLVPAEGKATAGVLWEGIEPSDFALLDRYESDLYERRNVNVVPQGASPARTASVYLLPDRHREFLSNEAWDPERFARQHLVETVAHCERFRRSLSVTGVS